MPWRGCGAALPPPGTGPPAPLDPAVGGRRLPVAPARPGRPAAGALLRRRSGVAEPSPDRNGRQPQRVSAGGLQTAEEFAEAFAASGSTSSADWRSASTRPPIVGALKARAPGGIDDRRDRNRHRPRLSVAQRELAPRIAERGAIVSRVSARHAAARPHFPRRNRLISGLSRGVLVVEAQLGSGSLITARFAGEQGKDVFAIPGSIHSPFSKGCHSADQGRREAGRDGQRRARGTPLAGYGHCPVVRP